LKPNRRRQCFPVDSSLPRQLELPGFRVGARAFSLHSRQPPPPRPILEEIVEERSPGGNASSAAASSSRARSDTAGISVSWQCAHASREVIHSGTSAQVLSGRRPTTLREPVGPRRSCFTKRLD